MKTIDSSISDIGWNMSFIYNVSASDYPEILRLLEQEGAGTTVLDNARSLLNDNQYNSAITYTDKRRRKTWMIFTDITAQNEFVNSLVHETLHLSRHIADCGNSEILCNAIGNLAGALFKAVYNN